MKGLKLTMNKILCSVLSAVLLVVLAGCNRENQPPMDLTQSTESEAKTSEIVESINPETLAVADKCALRLQSLYNEYCWKDFDDPLIKVEVDPLAVVLEDSVRLNVTDEKIKSVDDIKKIVIQYCTDEFADKLIKSFCYGEEDGRLYVMYSDKDYPRHVSNNYIDTYIKDCKTNDNKMTITFTAVHDPFNDRFKYDNTVVKTDLDFTMELVNEGDNWLISDLSEIWYYVYIGDFYKVDKDKDKEENITETEEIITEYPPDDIDLIEVADEYAQTFQNLFLDYLQYNSDYLAIRVTDKYKNEHIPEYVIYRGRPFFPVEDDYIKCYDDLKRIFTEYCTDEFADELLRDVEYYDIKGKLYRSENEKGNIFAGTVGNYISDCKIEKNKMIVDIIDVGAENEELFPQRLTEEEMALQYPGAHTHDEHFTMTLKWKDGKWLIEDISPWHDQIGYCYRHELTMSQNGRNPDGSVIEG